MTQEQKDLLLKDLSARLPYGVKILYEGWNYEWDQELSTLEKVTGIDEKFIYTKIINDNGEEYTSDRHTISLFDGKPYLFPLSSMTEEQKNNCPLSETNLNIINSNIGYGIIETPWKLTYLFIEWCNKNHFDYRGLIDKGLAINATNLNIY